MTRKAIEILAPAGDWEMLRAAVFSGADCVYLGVDGFNARRTAANFAGDRLAEAVSFCHARNCRVYVALNTLVFPGQNQQLVEVINQLSWVGCDAVIVQDLGVARLVKQIAPNLALHASTQMSIHSLAGAQMLQKMGFSRAILARELRADEIRAIAEQSSIELEVFVHGALCVAVSGQCYMSSFLGGRSANRGGCAGPCRLPFQAVCDAQMNPDSWARQPHHLSLKDLSILDWLPELEEIGVVSAKIEGRLRGPEYCAVTVDAALKARDGLPYDREMLCKVFSRDGFTDGWYKGIYNNAMFGRRTSEDAAVAKKALPAARGLYRRERPRVPVSIHLWLTPEQGGLEITDGVNEVRFEIPGPLPSAEKDATELLRAVIQKTGGTPFYVKPQDLRVETGGCYFPASQAGGLRRKGLEQLLQMRESRPELVPCAQIVRANPKKPFGGTEALPMVRGRFECLEQMSPQAADLCEELVLPLEAAQQLPVGLRKKTWLWMPRVLFGEKEADFAGLLREACQMEFAGVELQNLAHVELCKQNLDGMRMSAGFGLNLTNSKSVEVIRDLGCDTATLSPELRLAQLRQVVEYSPEGIRLDMLGYGHMPLMMTRACPIRNLRNSCAGCPKKGSLLDRKGEKMPLICRDGVRNIYNPVPLWMADRLPELPTELVTLYFTTETPQQAEQVLLDFREHKMASGRFTRGLYDRGTDDS